MRASSRAAQLFGLVRRDVHEFFRQPRLIVVLVAGPFVVLLLFASGYDTNATRLRTQFVGPAGSVYEDSIEAYADDVERYVEIDGFTTDLVEAADRVADGSVDIVVVFPPDPIDTVIAGEQAEIVILHDKIDPLERTAVEIAAQVAVAELNATILESLVAEAQGTLPPLDDGVDRAASLAEELQDVSASDEAIGGQISELRSAVDDMLSVTSISDTLLVQLGGAVDADASRRNDELRATLIDLDASLDRLSTAESRADRQRRADETLELVSLLSTHAEDIVTIDPRVAIRPFTTDTQSLLRSEVRVNDFFAPSAIGLLLQHLTLTIAALALVRDEQLGLFEAFRVGPISPRHVLVGKYVSFLLLGGLVGAALLASVVYGLDVPMRGDLSWLALGTALLLLGSIGLGLTLSALARSDLQAIQYAMLALLAGLFFGGFFLSLDSFRYPIRLVSWTMPVTYAIRLLQDVMLRGLGPARADLLGLVGTAVAYGLTSWALLRRRLAIR